MKIAIIIFVLSLVFNSKIEITDFDIYTDNYKTKTAIKTITFLSMIGSFIAIVLMV